MSASCLSEEIYGNPLPNNFPPIPCTPALSSDSLKEEKKDEDSAMKASCCPLGNDSGPSVAIFGSQESESEEEEKKDATVDETEDDSEIHSLILGDSDSSSSASASASCSASSSESETEVEESEEEKEEYLRLIQKNSSLFVTPVARNSFRLLPVKEKYSLFSLLQRQSSSSSLEGFGKGNSRILAPPATEASNSDAVADGDGNDEAEPPKSSLEAALLQKRRNLVRKNSVMLIDLRERYNE